MRKLVLLAAVATMVAGAATAQPYYDRSGKPMGPMSRTGRSPGYPVDLGPHTPDANRAYMGGGLVLEGAPGAPAPMPMATDPRMSQGGVVRVP